MFDVAIVQLLMHHRGMWQDITHVEVWMTVFYTRQITVIEDVAFSCQNTFRALDATVHVQFSMAMMNRVLTVADLNATRHPRHLFILPSYLRTINGLAFWYSFW